MVEFDAPDYVVLVVGDLDRALAFYCETLGFEAERPDPRAPGFELGFKVDECDAAYNELAEAGVESVAPPTDRPWGQRTAYVRDPDGHLVELAQDLEA